MRDKDWSSVLIVVLGLMGIGLLFGSTISFFLCTGTPLGDGYLIPGCTYTLKGEAWKWDNMYLVLISEDGQQPKYFALPEVPPKSFIVIFNEKGEKEYLERSEEETAENASPGDVDSGSSPE